MNVADQICLRHIWSGKTFAGAWNPVTTRSCCDEGTIIWSYEECVREGVYQHVGCREGKHVICLVTFGYLSLIDCLAFSSAHFRC